MGRKSKKQKIYDPYTATLAADAFQNLAEVFIKDIDLDMEKAARFAADYRGKLIASATNLDFSVELYLKALRVRSRAGMSETPNLWSLYDGLPENLKRSIKADYDRHNPREDEGATAFFVAIWPGIDPPEDLSARMRAEGKRVSSMDLRRVLQRSRDAFQTWRYLYEAAQNDRVMIYPYEFYRFRLIAEVLRRHLVDGWKEER